MRDNRLERPVELMTAFFSDPLNALYQSNGGVVAQRRQNRREMHIGRFRNSGLANTGNHWVQL